MRFLVLGGSQRSGTTMMQMLLNRHPAIAMTNHMNLKKFNEAVVGLFYREREIEPFRDAPSRKKNPKESWTFRDVEQATFSSSLAGGVIELLYRRHFDGWKKPGEIVYFADKDNPYYRYADYLVEHLQPFYAIHLTRNPFCAINSMKRRMLNAADGNDKGWMVFSFERMLKDWQEAFDFILKFEQDYEQASHIQYEDVVFHTEATLAAMFERLELLFELEEGYEIVKDPKHHFERQYLSEEDIEQIESEVDVKGYAEYIVARGAAPESLEHLP